MTFRIPLVFSLLLGAAVTAQAQTPAATATDPATTKAEPKKAPAKKAPPKKASTAANKAPTKATNAVTVTKGGKAVTVPKGTTYSTGPKELKDKDGKVIPTDPAAYPIDSALPKK